MMFENEITISGQNALEFQKMLESPQERVLVERDEFVSDVDIEVSPNGDIVVDCNCDFEDVFQCSEICGVLVAVKREDVYDTTSINVESSRKSSNAISRLIDSVWIDSEHTYAYGEQCKYASSKKNAYISDMLAVAS